MLLHCVCFPIKQGFHDGSVVKNLPANAGDLGSIPGSGKFPGEGNGNPWTEEPGRLQFMGSITKVMTPSSGT